MNIPVNYAHAVNEALNRLLDAGLPAKKALRLAEEHADACAAVGQCSPKPVDWDAP